MKNLTLLSIGIIVSSLLAIVVDTFIVSPDTRNMVIVSTSGGVFTLLCANYFSSLNFINKFGKPALFFTCSLLIQMLVLILGGVRSPFFIFLHLFLIGTSFMFGITLSVMFLITSMFALLFQIMTKAEATALFLKTL